MKILIVFLLLLLPTLVSAQDNQQLINRIEQLEARIQRLESKLGLDAENQQQQQQQAQGLVSARYWISPDADFEQLPPLRQGLMTLPQTISLAPAQFGYQSEGMFDEIKDVSRNPVVAAYIDGTLKIEKSANYQLMVKPTPPREVGGSGNVKLSVRIRLDDKQVLNLPASSRLSPSQQQIWLQAGNIPIHIEIVAQSPGFGPSPSGSKVFIGLQSADAISPVPISNLLVTQPRQ
jgi:hypothetical protein